MPALEDQLLNYQAQIEERQAFISSLVDAAGDRDLNESEMKMVVDATDKIKVLQAASGPLAEASRVSLEARNRFADIQKHLVLQRNPDAKVAPVEYRSAGAFVLDKWGASIGMEDARKRLDVWGRAAAHQTTADNLGVIPDPVVGSVLQFIDAQRPIVSMLGPIAAPSANFHRPKVTQHTLVAAQSAEKAELSSQKMLITRVAVSMETYGGYVNVSRQDVDFSMPSIMDLVINDLAAQYAIVTEGVVGTDLVAGATAQTPVITTSSTAAEVTASVWKASAAVYTAMRGAGRNFVAAAPDMMAAFGQAFTPATAPTNPDYSSGFTAAGFGQGVQGTVAGVPVVMSSGLASGKALLINTAAAEVYETRGGALQVTEPSVLGVQVAYFGYFQDIILAATGIIKLTA